MKKLFILGVFGALLLSACKKETTNPTSSTSTNTVNTNPDVITFNPNISYGFVSDVDGNVYKTVKIAGKEWMAENLKVKRYNNGVPIQMFLWNGTQQSNIDWMESGVDNWKYFSADSLQASKYFKTYGLQYNWKVVSNVNNVCPSGWHVPTSNEFLDLINSQGGMYKAGNKLIETTSAHWKNHPDATNESGFTALPSGSFVYGYNWNDAVTYWSSTANDYYDTDSVFRNTQAKVLSLLDVSKVEVMDYNKINGTVIRCVKD
jgi:uncharacterized protein (TIGR02145 family)